ncbi:MAG: class I SAM-dependent methyltransferase [Bacteroidetes bacterium]|nr:class I SAM-dependent methyltransferase [Bacteroidota bacterium]
MSTPNKPIYSSAEIIDFYSERLKEFGDSSRGVGWKNDRAQIIRFLQLARVFQKREHFSVNDFGCGTGEFYKFLLSQNFNEVTYNGYDILPDMVAAATEKIGQHSNVRLYKIDSPADLVSADYSVASGVFNVKYEATDSEWLSHILSALNVLNAKSIMGFSVNFLTLYSDKEFKQSYLYYADPLFIFDHCLKNFSKNVALLHDYDQFDFTIIVRKN